MARIRNTMIPNAFGDGNVQEIIGDDGHTYRLENSMVPNIFGDGQQKILTRDDGKSYTIKNSMVPNIFGDGYQQEIVENECITKNMNNGYSSYECSLPLEIRQRIDKMQGLVDDKPVKIHGPSIGMVAFMFLGCLIFPIIALMISVFMNMLGDWKSFPCWCVTIISIIPIIIFKIYNHKMTSYLRE